MQDRSPWARVRRGRGFEHAVNVLFGHGLAAQPSLGVEALRREEAARHVDDDAADLDARHSLGRVDGESRSLLRRLKVDDRAALDPVRALMADAEHFASVSSAAQRARRLHRAQPRDEANDFRGADVENRQDRALARRDLAHARRGARKLMAALLFSAHGRRPIRPPPAATAARTRAPASVDRVRARRGQEYATGDGDAAGPRPQPADRSPEA